MNNINTIIKFAIVIPKTWYFTPNINPKIQNNTVNAVKIIDKPLISFFVYKFEENILIRECKSDVAREIPYNFITIGSWYVFSYKTTRGLAIIIYIMQVNITNGYILLLCLAFETKNKDERVLEK